MNSWTQQSKVNRVNTNPLQNNEVFAPLSGTDTVHSGWPSDILIFATKINIIRSFNAFTHPKTIFPRVATRFFNSCRKWANNSHYIFADMWIIPIPQINSISLWWIIYSWSHDYKWERLLCTTVPTWRWCNTCSTSVHLQTQPAIVYPDFPATSVRSEHPAGLNKSKKVLCFCRGATTKALRVLFPHRQLFLREKKVVRDETASNFCQRGVSEESRLDLVSLQTLRFTV